MARILASFCLLISPAPLLADDAAGVKQTIAYVQKLQTSTGGFTSMPPAPNIRIAPTLRATSAGVRALHYLGGAVSNRTAAIKFVENCWDANAGGFTDFAGGNKVELFTTAVGLMAVAELKMPKETYAPAAARYLAANATSFEDIRIAVAGLESVGLTSPLGAKWRAAVLKLQNADGSLGKGPGQARATGGAIVCLLRLGGTWSPDRDAVLKILNDGQRRNGGFGKDEENSADLETTYRVMRCYVMLKARPDNVEGVRSFVAKCRNEDGGYGPAPGEPSNINATYFAAIIRHWLNKKD